MRVCSEAAYASLAVQARRAVLYQPLHADEQGPLANSYCAITSSGMHHLVTGHSDIHY